MNAPRIGLGDAGAVAEAALEGCATEAATDRSPINAAAASFKQSRRVGRFFVFIVSSGSPQSGLRDTSLPEAAADSERRFHG
jgi:hypothetical protein